MTHLLHRACCGIEFKHLWYYFYKNLGICIRQPGAKRSVLYVTFPPIFFQVHLSIILIRIWEFVSSNQEQRGVYCRFLSRQYFFIDFWTLFLEKFGNLYPATRSKEECTVGYLPANMFSSTFEYYFYKNLGISMRKPGAKRIVL